MVYVVYEALLYNCFDRLYVIILTVGGGLIIMVSEYLGVDQELAFDELVRRLSHKGYDLHTYETKNLMEIESLIDNNEISSEN